MMYSLKSLLLVTPVSAILLSYYLGIGKSCVLKRLVDNEFKAEHDVTVGVEFGQYLIKVEDCIMKMQMWDTAG